MFKNSVAASSHRRSLALCVGLALLVTTAVSAADRRSPAEARATYEKDRAACMNGQTNQDRATCLREAAAARQESGRGRLDDGQAEFEKNRLLRCDRQPLEDRADCIRRMNGEGTTSGSVESGGIYRELVTPVVAPAVPQRVN